MAVSNDGDRRPSGPIRRPLSTLVDVTCVFGVAVFSILPSDIGFFTAFCMVYMLTSPRATCVCFSDILKKIHLIYLI